MAKTRALDLLSLWEAAIPLAKARLQFSEPELLLKLDRLPQRTISEILNFSPQKPIPTNSELFSQMAVSSQEIAAFNKSRDCVMREINQNFLEMIARRDLRCFAFEAPRSLSASPVEMLPTHWTQMPDWDKGTFQHAGLHLVEMRIMATKNSAELHTNYAVAAAGRPSFRVEILEAYEALIADASFVSKPLTHGIVQVRAWIKKNKPNSKAAHSILGNGVIRNILTSELKKHDV